MDYGLCLPNFREGASREGMEAAAETAERLDWSTTAEVRAFESLGVSHLALWFDATDPAEVSSLAERFAREVAPLV